MPAEWGHARVPGAPWGVRRSGEAGSPRHPPWEPWAGSEPGTDPRRVVLGSCTGRTPAILPRLHSSHYAGGTGPSPEVLSRGGETATRLTIMKTYPSITIGILLASCQLRPSLGSEPPPPGGAVLRGIQTSLVESYTLLRAEDWNEAWRAFQAIPNDLPASEAGPAADPRPDPARLSSSLARADGFARSGQPDAAHKILANLTRGKVDSPLPYDLEAMIRIRNQDLPGAMLVLSEAPPNGPGRAHTLTLKAYVLLRQQQVAQARALLDENRAELEDFFLAWNVRGCVAFALGNPSEAIQDFERAVVLNPEFTVARANVEATSRARARKLFEKAGENPELRAKGLLGGTGAFFADVQYSHNTGLSIHGGIKVGANYHGLGPGGGLFASSTELLADARPAGHAGIPETASASSTNASGGEPSKGAEFEISCPLLIWK